MKLGLCLYGVCFRLGNTNKPLKSTVVQWIASLAEPRNLRMYTHYYSKSLWMPHTTQRTVHSPTCQYITLMQCFPAFICQVGQTVPQSGDTNLYSEALLYLTQPILHVSRREFSITHCRLCKLHRAIYSLPPLGGDAEGEERLPRGGFWWYGESKHSG